MGLLINFHMKTGLANFFKRSIVKVLPNVFERRLSDQNMDNKIESRRNWFASGGENYARYRPDYPKELAQYLATLTSDHQSALDVGCGTGQLTVRLADYFTQVTGVDPSEEQIKHAVSHSRVNYASAPAEALPDAFHGYNLITAAQAAHWFTLEDFYREVRRVAAPQGILALISYGVMQLEDDLNTKFLHFYQNEIGAYWPEERRLVDNGYRELDFPFEEIKAPSLYIRLEWPLEALIGYITTWSSVARAREACQETMLVRFFNDLADNWGPPSTCRPICWPINMRIGRVNK